MKKYTNEELDAAFSKLNMYYFATSNRLVQDTMYKNMQELAEEATRRDVSLKAKLNQYIIALKGFVTNDSRKQSTNDSN
jgi:hypothetical protein